MTGRLHAQQHAFASHLRDPDGAPAPEGIEPRRMAVYRELFYNNIESLLAGNFPVLRKLLGAAQWQRLVRAFYRDHGAQTPLFPQIAREFLHYLDARLARGMQDPALDLPYALELAHYEWVELALSLDETDLATVPHEREGNLLDGVPVVSPLAWPLAYRWPVHRIAPGQQPAEAPASPTLLLVVRGRDDVVRFKQLNALAFELLQRLRGNATSTGRALLSGMAAESGGNPDALVASGSALLEQLREREALLGTVPGSGDCKE